MDSKTVGQEFVRTVLAALVDNPEDLTVRCAIDERGVFIEVSPHPDDLGRVIGKQGATIQALRTIMRAFGTKNDARYSVKVIVHDQL